MKNRIKSFILGAGIVSMFACSDFLDQNSPSEMTNEVVFNSVTYTSQVLNKVYSGLTLDHTYGARIPLNFATNTDIELIDALGVDNIKAVNERGLGNYYPSTAWTRLDNNWKSCFEIIENANIVVTGIENSPLIEEGNPNRTRMLAYKGEALTLRAMVYLDLIRHYGDVPMKFEPTKSDASNANLPKADRDSIMDHLITHLEEAAQILPWAGQSSYTTERITAGFAKGLLARIALTRGGYALRDRVTFPKPGSVGDYPTERDEENYRKYYEIALTHLDEIIASNVHQLNPSYEDLWNKINQRTLDNVYKENMYEVAHGLNFSGEMGYTIGVRLNGDNSYYGKGNSSGKVKLTAPFFWSFDKSDIRRDITCITYEIRPDATNGNAPIDVMQGNAPFQLYVAKWDPRKMGDEWLAANRAATEKFGYGINWIVMRYSDVLLMYAEVLNELRGADVAGTKSGLTAREALRLVRSRAFPESEQANVDVYINGLSSGESFFNAIVDEKAWEFAGEAVRKYDLIRWNLLSTKIEEFKQDYINLIEVAPQYLYYKMKEDNPTEIDRTSIAWYEEPDNTEDYLRVNGWGTRESGSGTTNDTHLENLEYISMGLNDSDVKNRYLIPMGNTTISESNGVLQNAYGF